MTAVSAPSRDTRIPLSTSVLIVMLLSIPMTAGVRGSVDPVARAALSTARVLPTEIACRLRDGIRYEMPACPAETTPARDEPRGAQLMRVAPAPLHELLLDLPPPALA